MNRIILYYTLGLIIYIIPIILSGQQYQISDTIFQKDGREILCKVLKISGDRVKIDPEGPISLKTISGKNIKSIKFSTGLVLSFPLPPNYEYIAETTDYDSPVVIKKKRNVTVSSIVFGYYKGDNTDAVLGIPTRFDDSTIMGFKATVYRPEFKASKGTLGFNMVFSFSKYFLSSRLFYNYMRLIDGTALNLDMNGEYLLFDVRKISLPNPYITAGFGLTRFVGEDVNELDLSINYGAGVRVLLSKKIGISINWRKRPVWVKDMGSPNFTEISGEIFFQKASS